MPRPAGGNCGASPKTAGAINPDVDLGDVFKLVAAIARAGEGSPDGSELGNRLLDLSMDGRRSGTGARPTQART